MKKVISNVLTLLILALIVFMSVILLSYNEYKVPVFGNKTLLIIDEDMKDFKEGSLLIVKRKDSDKYVSGDYIFYYDTSGSKVKTVLAPIIDLYAEVNGEKSYLVADDYVVEEEYIIGKSTNVKEYKTVGKVLSVLESKWGNLFLVVVPAFLLCVYEIYNLAYEIAMFRRKKTVKKNKTKEEE